jgi:predicted DNA-binding protein
MEPYRLPQSIQERLQARARKTGRSLTEVTRQAVLDEIEAIEDYYHALSLVRPPPRRRAGGGGPSQ